MEHKDPIATAQFQQKSHPKRQIILNLLALISGAVATAFFATAGPVDPLRDTFFSLAIALDLLTLFLVWKSLEFGVPWWLQAEEERGPFILRIPEAGATLVVRTLRGPWSRVRVIWHGPLWRYACLLAATFLYGAGLALFLLQGETTLTYLAWLGGVGLLLVAYMPLERPRLRLHIGSTLVVLGLLAVGLFLRLYHLEQLPLKVHGDMASVGLQAREILAGRSPGWFALGWATIPMWGYAHEALTMRIWGDTLYGLRMSAVLSGMFSLLGVYFLGKEGWVERVGIWALAALVIDVVHIHFSRIPSYIDPVPWAVWSLYFLLHGYHRRSPLYWALAGITAAVATNMYFSGRVLIPVVLLFLLYVFLFHRRVWNENKEGVVALFLGAIFALGPMLLVIIRFLPMYMSRARFVLITDPGVYHHLLLKYQASSLREIIIEQLQRTFLTYQYYGDTSTQFGYTHPMLNPWIVPFFLIGVGVLTGKLRHAGNFLVSTWLFLGLVAGSALTTDAPFWPRLVILTPANALAIGIGMVWLGELLGMDRHRWRALLWTGAMGVLLIWAGWLNWSTYTREIGGQAGWNDFAARVILSLGERPACYVRGNHSLDEREFRFLLKGRDDLEIHLTTWRDDAAQCAKRHGVVVALPDERSLVDLIVETYPGGRLSEIRSPIGNPQIVIYEMP